MSGSVFGRGPSASTSLTAAAATQPAMSQGLHTRVSPRHPLLQHLPQLMLILATSTAADQHLDTPGLAHPGVCAVTSLGSLVQVDAFY